MTNETNPGTVERQDRDAIDVLRTVLHSIVRSGKAERIDIPHITRGVTAIDRLLSQPAAQSQPAATVQEVGREARQKTVAQAVANIVGAPYDDWRHFTNEADAILARLAALTAEPAAKARDADKLFAAINKEAKRANEVIRLNRHREGQGMITVATAMHRIEKWSERLSPPSPQPDMGSVRVVDMVNMHKRLRAVVLNNAGQTLTEALMDGLEPDSGDEFAGTLYQACDRLALAALSPPASQSVEEMKEALERMRAAGEGVLAALDNINEKHGTAYGGPAFFEMGRAIHQATLALPHKEEATPATTTTEQGRG